MATPLIFHITTEAVWEQAMKAGIYTADSLTTEGFVHCSDAHQVAWVANIRFRGRRNLVLLHVFESQLAATVRRENLEGGEWLFPHVYGPIPVSAIAAVTAFAPSSDGTFDAAAANLVQKSIDTIRAAG